MTKIVWSGRARNQFDKIYQYWIIHNNSKYYSEKILDETLRIIILLKSQIHIGQKSNHKEIRRVLILDKFSLSYRITPKEIKIVSFFDNRRDPKKNTHK